MPVQELVQFAGISRDNPYLKIIPYCRPGIGIGQDVGINAVWRPDAKGDAAHRQLLYFQMQSLPSFRELEQFLAIGREPDLLASPAAVDQVQAEMPFEDLQSVTDGRLGNMQLVSGLRKGAVTNDGKKRREIQVENSRSQI
jgi:hypothetical protein